MDVKHPQVTGKCKFGEKCERRKTCPYTHFGGKTKKLGVPAVRKNAPKSLHELKTTLAPYVDMVKTHITKRDAEVKAEEQRFLRESKQSGYFGADNKSVADVLSHEKTLARIKSEFDEAVLLVKKMVLNVVGMKAIKVPMVQQQNFASTITTGVVNTTANITANNFVDFSTFALIFEEYRIVGGHYIFQSSVPAAYGASTPANTGPIFGVLCYSQITASLANVAAGWDDVQKHIINMSNLNSGFTDSMQKPETFHYKIPAGILDDANSANAGNWCLVANNTVIWGVLRPYCIILSAAVVANAIGGINTVEMEFRMRL